jgi:hypothetical protein
VLLLKRRVFITAICLGVKQREVANAVIRFTFTGFVPCSMDMFNVPLVSVTCFAFVNVKWKTILFFTFTYQCRDIEQQKQFADFRIIVAVRYI